MLPQAVCTKLQETHPRPAPRSQALTAGLQDLPRGSSAFPTTAELRLPSIQLMEIRPRPRQPALCAAHQAGLHRGHDTRVILGVRSPIHPDTISLLPGFLVGVSKCSSYIAGPNYATFLVVRVTLLSDSCLVGSFYWFVQVRVIFLAVELK